MDQEPLDGWRRRICVACGSAGLIISGLACLGLQIAYQMQHRDAASAWSAWLWVVLGIGVLMLGGLHMEEVWHGLEGMHQRCLLLLCHLAFVASICTLLMGLTLWSLLAWLVWSLLLISLSLSRGWQPRPHIGRPVLWLCFALLLAACVWRGPWQPWLLRLPWLLTMATAVVERACSALLKRKGEQRQAWTQAGRTS